MAKMLKIYYVKNDYIDVLRNYDKKVMYNKNQTRPYVGVAIKFNNHTYFAPLSSPKPKHLTMNDKAIDIFKIDGGQYGIVNINNMIPVPRNCLIEVLPTLPNGKYKNLIINQTTYLNDNRSKLLTKIKNFRNLADRDHLPPNVKSRCCNFNKLEYVCTIYEHSDVFKKKKVEEEKSITNYYSMSKTNESNVNNNISEFIENIEIDITKKKKPNSSNISNESNDLIDEFDIDK